MTAGQTQRYVPAAGRAGLTGLYDPVVALTMRERRWRPALLDRVSGRIPSAGTVLDVGAGTGSFAIALAAARPDLTVIGVDGDPGVLARAPRQTARRGGRLARGACRGAAVRRRHRGRGHDVAAAPPPRAGREASGADGRAPCA